MLPSTVALSLDAGVPDARSSKGYNAARQPGKREHAEVGCAREDHANDHECRAPDRIARSREGCGFASAPPAPTSRCVAPHRLLEKEAAERSEQEHSSPILRYKTLDGLTPCCPTGWALSCVANAADGP
jgi:hypothetical protein